jgi:single-stranded DNA-binding protein
VERYTTEIVANEMLMLDSRGAGASNNFTQEKAAAPIGAETHDMPVPNTNLHVDEPIEDDIPF